MLKKLLYSLPAPVIYRLLNFRESLQGSKKAHYSQFGEDVILEFLTRGQKTGLYVDIGANHPKKSSNTYLLHKRGWRGINIEPDPYLYSLLKRYRSGDKNIQAGVGLTQGEATYYRFADSRLGTFSESRADELLAKDWKLIEKKAIPIVPLSKILDKPMAVDVMNIDAEDYDLQVLQSNNWSNISPRIIVVESRAFDIENPNADEIYSFLKAKGYRLAAKAAYSLIFASSAASG